MQDGREQLQIQDFPDGGTNPIGSASTYHLVTVLPKKLHENERNWTEAGEGVKSACLGSTNGSAMTTPKAQHSRRQHETVVLITTSSLEICNRHAEFKIMLPFTYEFAAWNISSF